MKEERYSVTLDEAEHSLIIRALNDLRTDLLQKQKSADAVNELIIKVGKAPLKRQKAAKAFEQTGR